jgi:hypothetical protein
VPWSTVDRTFLEYADHEYQLLREGERLAVVGTDGGHAVVGKYAQITERMLDAKLTRAVRPTTTRERI